MSTLESIDNGTCIEVKGLLYMLSKIVVRYSTAVYLKNMKIKQREQAQ